MQHSLILPQTISIAYLVSCCHCVVAAARCQLGRNRWGYTFHNSDLSAYMASLFYSIAAGRAAAAKQLGAPAPRLDRYDLFHGHMFTAWNCSSSCVALPDANSTHRRHLRAQVNQSHTAAACQQLHKPSHTCCSSINSPCQVGILFHAAEYPAYEEDVFPINLGHCQVNSSCRYSERSMDLRNILWWKVCISPSSVTTGRGCVWCFVTLCLPDVVTGGGHVQMHTAIKLCSGFCGVTGMGPNPIA